MKTLILASARNAVLWAILFLVSTGCAPAASKIEAATPRDLFVNTNKPASVQLKTDSTILRSRVVEINFDALIGTPAPSPNPTQPVQIVRLNLFDDAAFVATLDRVDGKFPDSFVWVGHVDNAPTSQVTLSVNGKVMQGAVVVADKFYQVRFAGDGLYAVYQVNQAAFPPD